MPRIGKVRPVLPNARVGIVPAVVAGAAGFDGSSAETADGNIVPPRTAVPVPTATPAFKKSRRFKSELRGSIASAPVRSSKGTLLKPEYPRAGGKATTNSLNLRETDDAWRVD